MVNLFNKDKKGIARIIEASAAILIIFIIIITFGVTRDTRTEKDLSETITPLLEEIAQNNTIRDEIISDSPNVNNTIEEFLESRIKETNLEYDFNICDVGSLCGQRSYPEEIKGNIYAGSRIISSSLEQATPRKISIFLWVKK